MSFMQHLINQKNPIDPGLFATVETLLAKIQSKDWQDLGDGTFLINGLDIPSSPPDAGNRPYAKHRKSDVIRSTFDGIAYVPYKSSPSLLTAREIDGKIHILYCPKEPESIDQRLANAQKILSQIKATLQQPPMALPEELAPTGGYGQLLFDRRGLVLSSSNASNILYFLRNVAHYHGLNDQLLVGESATREDYDYIAATRHSPSDPWQKFNSRNSPIPWFSNEMNYFFQKEGAGEILCHFPPLLMETMLKAEGLSVAPNVGIGNATTSKTR